MIRMTQVSLPVSHDREALERKIRKLLRISSEPFTYEIERRSLDARNPQEKVYRYTLDVTISNEKRILKKVHNKNIMSINKTRYHFPKSGEEPLITRPVIVGSGPAGLFCGWYLARAGYRPLILERGEQVRERRRTVERFWKEGILDSESNVQFGEGGAGTFSDGKLNTLVKDPLGRNKEVLKRFVKAGAPKEILYEQKPHLGTDVLASIVETLRKQIEAMGGSFRFGTKLTGLKLEDNTLQSLILNGEEELKAQVCVLAIGHSARDTFSMLHGCGLPMEPKSFAVGLRIEHPQKMINQALYEAGGGKIPVQTLKDYCKNQAGSSLGQVKPLMKGAWTLANVREILPRQIGDSIEEGIYAFDKKIPGFAREDALLSAVESRTSSPVRILRGENCESQVSGIYPCGEGAGYAGGITSAAMDGMKVAEGISRRFQKCEIS